MKVAAIVADTQAEGPGRRFAIWTRGCTLRCPGCCNPELFDAAGPDTPVPELLARIRDTPGIEGISLLGGEPTEQPDLADLCAGVRALGLTVMLFSGRTLTELQRTHADLLPHIDLLVDGRYSVAHADPSRRWIGSANQRLHRLTDAYAKDDPRFDAPNTIEVRFGADGLVVNGWPTAADQVVG